MPVIMLIAHGPDAAARRVVEFEGWRFDRLLRQLLSPDDMVIVPSDAEFRLLCAFVDRPGRVPSRDQPIDLTRAPGVEVNDRSIDLSVSRLRQTSRGCARNSATRPRRRA